MRFWKRFEKLELAATWIFFTVLVLALVPSAKSNIFQARDFKRALALFDGHFTFWGPEVTGGGHLPGPLYYWLIALPLKLAAWPAVWVLMAALGGLGFAIFFRHLSRQFGSLSAMFGVLFLITSGWLFTVFGSFMNSSFAPLFNVLALSSLSLFYTPGGASRHFYWFCLWVALGIQIHFSVAILLLVPFICGATAKYTGLKMVSLRQLATGAAFFVLPVAPFLIWSAARWAGLPLGADPPDHSGALSGVAASFAANAPKLEKGWAGLDEPGLIPELVLDTNLTMLILLLPLVWIAFRRTDKAAINPQLYFWLICFAVAILPGFLIFPYLARNRYLIPLYFSCAGFLAASCSQVLKGSGEALSRQLLAGLALALLVRECLMMEYFPVHALPELAGVTFFGLVVAALTATMRFRPWMAVLLLLAAGAGGVRRQLGFSLVQSRTLQLLDLQQAAEAIHRRTGWTFEEARRRIFLINVHYEASMDFIYRWPSAAPSEKVPTGYFLVAMSRLERLLYDSRNTQEWLLDLPLEESILAALKDKSLTLDPPVKFSWGVLVPYRFTNEPFHNLGAYHDLRRPAAHLSSSGGERFRIADCDNENFCAIDFHVVAEPESGNGTRLSVQLEADVLSFPSPWISPMWSQGIREPWIEYSCGGERKTLTLAHWIGYREGQEYFMNLNSSLLAPVKRRYSIPCAGGEFKVVGAGYKSSQVYSNNRIIELPAERAVRL